MGDEVWGSLVYDSEGPVAGARMNPWRRYDRMTTAYDWVGRKAVILEQTVAE